MIEIVSEYIAREEARGQFELVFGSGGLWSQVFDQAAGYRGTTLLRDTSNPQRYLVIDIWDLEDQRDSLLASCETEYSVLEAALADWTESRTKVGVYQVRSGATVRRRRKPGRGGTGSAIA